MIRVFNFPNATRHCSEVEQWFCDHDDELGRIAQHWFKALRACGDDVRELLHDGQPTACVGAAAFAYVDVFKTHVNLGFFGGSELADPAGLLEGAGKFMRHVKLRPGSQPNADTLRALLDEAYAEMKARG